MADAHHIQSRFALLEQSLSGGPVRVVLPAYPTNWIEGTPPAPALSPSGALIASLAGTQGGLDQLVLFTRHGAAPRRVPLPGEPRLVAYAPTGARVVVVWDACSASGTVHHVGRATLVDTTTGATHDLGPAVAAFWR